MNSICNFIPAKNVANELKTVHFVYESEFEKMKQPFIHPIYYIHLVTRGEGVLVIGEKEHALKPGSLYFAFPGIPYAIRAESDFAYMYISFMGKEAGALLSKIGVTAAEPVYETPSELLPFWWRSIQRINSKNANLLTESVLLNTLSYISNDGDESKTKSESVIDSIICYVDNNYTDQEMSLKKIADIFAYTDKYLSHLFKENMKMNFSAYLSRLRITKAIEFMGKGAKNIDAIAEGCGFRDTGYFSKVFKKLMNLTPREYINNLKNGIHISE